MIDAQLLSHMLTSSVPLQVEGVDANEPFFSMFGDEPRWSVGVACEWVLKTESSEYDSEQIAIDDFRPLVTSLVGRIIVSIHLDTSLIDPIFDFDNGWRLMVRADTSLDPWVMSLPEAPVILVGRHHAEGKGDAGV